MYTDVILNNKSNDRMNITSLERQSTFAAELNFQLNKEWPEIGSFEKEMYGVSIPNPMGVLIDEAIIGGLSFTSAKAPQSEEIVVWINAVLVQPSYRHRGIASKLIAAAESTAEKLFALTDIPELYIKVGWQVVSYDSEGTVVKYEKFT